MTPDLNARWADLLVDYCLEVTPGATVVIASEWEGRPLVEACYRAVVAFWRKNSLSPGRSSRTRGCPPRSTTAR